jgi:hypothetical protein
MNFFATYRLDDAIQMTMLEVNIRPKQIINYQMTLM